MKKSRDMEALMMELSAIRGRMKEGIAANARHDALQPRLLTTSDEVVVRSPRPEADVFGVFGCGAVGHLGAADSSKALHTAPGWTVSRGMTLCVYHCGSCAMAGAIVCMAIAVEAVFLGSHDMVCRRP